MKTSDTLGELTTALLAAQAEFPTIPKTKTGTIPTKAGGSYSYSYADLPVIKAAIDPILSKFGLTVTQLPDGGGLNTTLLHQSGEFVSATADLFIAQQTAQGQGSAITYMRRYAYCAATGVVAEDDDDGAAATHQTPRPAFSQAERTKVAESIVDAFPGAQEVSPASPPQGKPASDKQWWLLAKIVNNHPEKVTQTMIQAVKSQYGAKTTREMGQLIDALNGAPPAENQFGGTGEAF